MTSTTATRHPHCTTSYRHREHTVHIYADEGRRLVGTDTCLGIWRQGPAHLAALGQCIAIGCTRPASQTATHDGDSRHGVVALCDLDAAYMATVPRYRAPGWGEHRSPAWSDDLGVLEEDARDQVEQHVRALLDSEDPVRDTFVAQCVNAVAAEDLLATVRRFHDGQAS